MLPAEEAFVEGAELVGHRLVAELVGEPPAPLAAEGLPERRVGGEAEDRGTEAVDVAEGAPLPAQRA